MSKPTRLQEFRINIPETDLDDLKYRLSRARFPDEKTPDWNRGVPTDYLQKVTRYWEKQFNWREQENRLNKFPQYRIDIEGQPIHFLHIRSSAPDAIPLLMLHGYPSSFTEFTAMVDLLTGASASVRFHLIIPSLPGFGFSIPRAAGSWDVMKIALAMAQLMTALDYERFAVHGTDMGAGVVGMLSGVAANRLIGTHINTDYTAVTGMGMLPAAPGSFSDEENQRIAHYRSYEKTGTAYLKLLATKPQSLAYSLTDSPVGLLAWIIEKFQAWTHSSRNLPEDAISLDWLLTNVSIYWFNKLGATSAHTLFDGMNAFDWSADAGAGQKEQTWQPPRIPSAIAAFGGDGELLKKLLGPMGNADRWTSYEEGLHFPALECPSLLAQDMISFFSSLRSLRE